MRPQTRHPPVAVMDIGSNSARLVVFRPSEGGYTQVLRDSRVPVRLAREVQDTGRIGEGGIDRTIRCLADFLALAHGAGVSAITAVATSAVREARDADLLLERAHTQLGLDIEVVSGATEARCAFLGAVYGLPVEAGVLIDVGGGSVEITRFRDRSMADAWSLPLGALRVSDAFLSQDPPSTEEIRSLQDHVAATIRETGLAPLAAGESLIATGGTVRNLAKIHRRTRDNYPVQRVHGYVLSAADLDGLLDILLRRNVARRASLPGLNADRADSVGGGAIVVKGVLEALGAPMLYVSGQGLREGLILRGAVNGRLPAPARVRDASVRELVTRFRDWDPEAADRRADVATGLLDVIGEVTVNSFREELRHAARLLQVGHDIDYYNRFDHAASVVLESDLAGFAHRDLALISGVIAMTDTSGMSLKSYRPLLSNGDRVIVAQLAGILAVAVHIEERLTPHVRMPLRWEREGKVVSLRSEIPGTWWTPALAARFRRALGLRLSA
jgi:exopolyphosphatase/guanosine-5'-triphosphate,3'-diphosphate pyrophosphatase